MAIKTRSAPIYTQSVIFNATKLFRGKKEKEEGILELLLIIIMMDN